MQLAVQENLLFWIFIPIISILLLCFSVLLGILIFQRNKKKKKNIDYLSKVIHDLKTPIYAIDGFTLLASKSLNQPKKAEEYLKKISNLSHHMLALVKDVIDLSKLRDNQIEMNSIIANMNEIIECCLEQVEPQMVERQISFEKDIQIKHIKVLVDNLHLTQILTNLLSNAIKYTEPKGKITLSIFENQQNEETSTYIFKIKDTGYGMSEEFQKHLFEPFAQERAFANTDVESSGLGLFIVKKLVEMMKGTIKVESKINEGSCFIVSLNLDIVSVIK